MAVNGIRHLPIVEDGVVVGMLSARDLMGRQLIEDRAAAEEVAMLSTCLKSIDINEQWRFWPIRPDMTSTRR